MIHHPENLNAMNRKFIPGWLQVTVIICVGLVSSFGQVTRNLGTLPPGGTVTITFDVSINVPFPPNVSSVTNQGIVTGTGFDPIVTDNPATDVFNDPTVTPLTVAPQITCPSTIITNASGSCPQYVSFSATVTAGVPAPVLTYKLGANVISSPYAFPAGTNVVSVTATNGTTPNASCSFNVIVLGGTAPRLNVAFNGITTVVWWPNIYPCYALQYASALSVPPATTVWNPYPGPFTFSGGNIYVTNSLSSSNLFFRLSY